MDDLGIPAVSNESNTEVIGRSNPEFIITPPSESGDGGSESGNGGSESGDGSSGSEEESSGPGDGSSGSEEESSGPGDGSSELGEESQEPSTSGEGTDKLNSTDINLDSCEFNVSNSNRQDYTNPHFCLIENNNSSIPPRESSEDPNNYD
jgi:hypothetical protein